MNAGQMDREVEIQQLADSAGASGYPIETWSTLDVVWMERVRVSQRERFLSAQLSAPIETRWRAYYREDMDPDRVDVVKARRLIYEGRAYDITSVVEIGRKDGLEISTIARSAVES